MTLRQSNKGVGGGAGILKQVTPLTLFEQQSQSKTSKNFSWGQNKPMIAVVQWVTECVASAPLLWDL